MKAISVAAGPTGGRLEGSGVRIAYASTAIDQAGGTVTLSRVDLRNAALALNVDGGGAAVRGTIRDVSMGIRAWDHWDESCGADASYVDWGSPEGPFRAPGPLVCGAVSVNPWLPIASDQSFWVGTCSGEPPGDIQVRTAATSLDTAVASLCDGTLLEACEYWIQTARPCYAAAIELAGTQIGFPLPSASTVESATEYSTTALGVVTDAWATLPDAEVPDPFRLASILLDVKQLSDVALALRDAAHGCSPG